MCGKKKFFSIDLVLEESKKMFSGYQVFILLGQK